MNDSTLLLSRRDDIASITLNAPERHNALTDAAVEHFLQLLDKVDADQSIRVLVIRASASETFCAGASLKQLANGQMSGERFEELTNRLAATGIPKIAAIGGNVYGGGAEIALCCDFRFGIEGMTLRVPAARLGLSYPLAGIQRYVHRLGPDNAKRLLVGCEEFDSGRLLDIGFLTRVVPAPELEPTVAEWAQRLASLAPLAVRTMLHICDGTANGTLDKEEAEALIARCRESGDFREGLRAQRERRTPRFTGK